MTPTLEAICCDVEERLLIWPAQEVVPSTYVNTADSFQVVAAGRDRPLASVALSGERLRVWDSAHALTLDLNDPESLAGLHRFLRGVGVRLRPLED